MKRSIPCALAALALASCSSPSHLELADVNKDKRLDINEFRIGWVNLLFEQIDANKDGRVTFQERKAADPTANKATFDSRDLNRDGSVSRDEAHANAKRFRSSDTLFHLIDTNGDGVIERSEGDAYAQKLRTTAPSR